MPGTEVSRRKGAASSRRRPMSEPDLVALDPSVLQEEDEAALTTRGAAYLQEYVRTERRSTLLMKNLAVVVIEMRRRFTTEDGLPDMRGRSYPYRERIAEVYLRAGVPEDSEDRIRANLRYHIGNLLREELTPQELEDYGLLPAAPRDRKRAKDAERDALVAAARAELTAGEADKAVVAARSASAPSQDEGGSPGSQAEKQPLVRVTADYIQLGKAASNIVGKMDVSVIDDVMTDGQRAKLDGYLASMQETLRKLRRHTRKRTSGT
ncbi:hypothetical protein AB0A77_02065 [Streptomyces varsoviensis]|uniref:hypothetical protein n=1 Tax=Streptomyces varsoviensis TaxID=67373 RepID=UPI0033FB4527